MANAQPLQWGRARAGAEMYHVGHSKELTGHASMGPRRAAEMRTQLRAQLVQQRFNGAAPARARKSPRRPSQIE